MTRIIAGEAKGRKLSVPAKGTRPTSDKVRGAIFSRLDSWGVVEDAEVLDLFAGSGALGIEAISRGAATAVLVEKSGPNASVAKRNAEMAGYRKKAQVVTADATAYLRGLSKVVRGFDLVFIDPPYSLTEEAVTEVLTALVPHLDQEATVVLERDVRSPAPSLPDALDFISERRWGDTTAWFLKVAGSET